jgi:hypothetical protein
MADRYLKEVSEAMGLGYFPDIKAFTGKSGAVVGVKEGYTVVST